MNQAVKEKEGPQSIQKGFATMNARLVTKKHGGRKNVCRFLLYKKERWAPRGVTLNSHLFRKTSMEDTQSARIEKLEKHAKRQSWNTCLFAIVNWAFFAFVSAELGWYSSIWMWGFLAVLSVLTLVIKGLRPTP